MKLHSMGIAFKHEKDFVINRPYGSGDNLLLVFKSPAFIYCGEKRIEVQGDTAVLFAKGSAQHYGALETEYTNHWVHFECDENDIFFNKTRAVFNAPVTVRSSAAAERILELLSLESVSGGECADLLLRLLIAKTVGAQPAQSAPSHKTAHSERLCEIRAELYANPSRLFSVNELAARASISPSYFQTLYKREFGVSCYEDVIRAKMELACYYLENTALSVCETAALCGYENEVHFMRQFKQRMGVTAREYRRGKLTPP